MGLTQMRALTGGRKYKRPYVEDINARTQYLPQIYGRKREDEYRTKMYDLQEQGLAQSEKMGLANIELSEEAAREAKKRNRTAKALGYANIGLAGGLGALKAYPALKGMGKDVIDWISPSAPVGPLGPLANVGKQASEPSIDWLSDAYTDYLSPAIKLLGGGAWDLGKGIYEGVVGDAIDWSDAAESFGDIF